MKNRKNSSLDTRDTGLARKRPLPWELPGAHWIGREELRLVSFHVSDQVFAVPIMLVQEVLRAVPATKLPAAPARLLSLSIFPNLHSSDGTPKGIFDLRYLAVPSKPEHGQPAFRGHYAGGKIADSLR